MIERVPAGPVPNPLQATAHSWLHRNPGDQPSAGPLCQCLHGSGPAPHAAEQMLGHVHAE